MSPSPSKPCMILDADTANEIDDLYAIARMLHQDQIELLGINSAQWFHYMSGMDSVHQSQRINEELLRITRREEIPALLGAEEALGMPWGGTTAKDSPAAQFIIEQARATPAGEKLIVACIGAATNLASAIKMAPDIAPRIDAYLMALIYNTETGVWNKADFNTRMDLNAADFILNQADLEVHYMTVDTSIHFKFDQADTFARQARMGELGAYLTDRWRTHAPDAERWVMWDLALIEAILHPEFATQRAVTTPPENVQRKVWVYDTIDLARMHADYWQAVMPEDV